MRIVTVSAGDRWGAGVLGHCIGAELLRALTRRGIRLTLGLFRGASVRRMSWRASTFLSTWVTVVGLASVLSLSVTAAAGLWLDFAYSPDASLAWDDIDALQNEIDRGLLIADVRSAWSVIAVASTVVWLGLTLRVWHRSALYITLVLALGVAAWGSGRDSTVIERSILECGAVGTGFAAVAYWLWRPSKSHLTDVRSS